MFTILRRTITPQLIKHLEINIVKKNYSNQIKQLLNTTICVQHNLNVYRYKSKSTKKSQTKVESSESEDQHDAEDSILDKHLKTANITVQSLRLDGVLKSGLGIARNKVETLFYESKIRVNGQKVQKKSITIQEGDEIDIIKGPSPSNPDFLIVARLEIMSIVDTGENINLKVRRAKSLTIEQYKE